MLDALPADTSRVLILPPYHHFRLPVEGSRDRAVLDECKLRLARLADSVPSTTLVDFWQRSRISLKDENYWDHVHYKVGIAPLIEQAVVNALFTGRGEEGLFRVLAWPGPPAAGSEAASLRDSGGRVP
jgi:hypothetical protein